MKIEFLATDLGLCLIGSMPGFDITDIDVVYKKVIDLKQPMTRWESDFKELDNISIFTSFESDNDIIATQQLLQLGRNSDKFCAVFTYDKDFSEAKYSKIKELAHLFISVDKYYCELEAFSNINPLICAFYNTYNVINTSAKEQYMDLFYYDRFFNMKKSSLAKLIIFKIKRSDYNDTGDLILSPEIKKKLEGYGSGLINTYPNWHLLDRQRYAIEDAVNSVSLRMSVTWHTSYGGYSFEEKNIAYICIIAFDRS